MATTAALFGALFAVPILMELVDAVRSSVLDRAAALVGSETPKSPAYIKVVHAVGQSVGVGLVVDGHWWMWPLIALVLVLVGPCGLAVVTLALAIAALAQMVYVAIARAEEEGPGQPARSRADSARRRSSVIVAA